MVAATQSWWRFLSLAVPSLQTTGHQWPWAVGHRNGQSVRWPGHEGRRGHVECELGTCALHEHSVCFPSFSEGTHTGFIRKELEVEKWGPSCRSEGRFTETRSIFTSVLCCSQDHSRATVAPPCWASSTGYLPPNTSCSASSDVSFHQQNSSFNCWARRKTFCTARFVWRGSDEALCRVTGGESSGVLTSLHRTLPDERAGVGPRRRHCGESVCQGPGRRSQRRDEVHGGGRRRGRCLWHPHRPQFPSRHHNCEEGNLSHFRGVSEHAWDVSEGCCTILMGISSNPRKALFSTIQKKTPFAYMYTLAVSFYRDGMRSQQK